MTLVINSERSQSTSGSFRPSAYNLLADTPDGDVVVLNTLSGSSVLFPAEDRDRTRALFAEDHLTADAANADMIEALVEIGLLVPVESNERRKLRFLQVNQTQSMKELQLIVFPTEKCNFRCVYCYEDFVQGKMAPELRSGLVRFVEQQARSLELLSLDWFGGEPLVAFDVMKDILPGAVEACREHRCKLTGHITTNGYLLTPEVAEQLLDWGVGSFQITLDGPREEHDRRRRLHRPSRDDDGTFDCIVENVQALLRQRRIFELQLRTNYDRESLPVMEAWIDELVDLVGDDPRVRVDFCPIWADPDQVEVSLVVGDVKQKTYVDLLAAAHQRGLRSNAPGYLRLGGLVCYAARANSLVVRSDGRLNKCTVALDADYNTVGHLRPDGSLELDPDRLAKWTQSGLEEDATCQSCAMSAACQGNACPLQRFENHRRPCPPPKNHPDPILNMAVPAHRH
jgi:uncharacterized protein